jgi:hypothetical protein
MLILVDIYQSLSHTHSSQFSSELHVSTQCGHHQVRKHMFEVTEVITVLSHNRLNLIKCLFLKR